MERSFSHVTLNMKHLTSYICNDQVGIIIKTVKHYNDFSTTIKQSKTYDVFGNVISTTGSSTGNLGFQSKYFDTESGMYYYYNRYYKPDLGRFLNEDPIGLSGGFNMFGFVGNDPVNFSDLFGLKITCKRISNWRRANTYNNVDNKGKLVSSHFEQHWVLKEEIPIGPASGDKMAALAYECVWGLKGLYKISKYIKSVLFRAQFKCVDDKTCESWYEDRYNEIEKEYKEIEKMDVLVPFNYQSITIQLSPCLPYKIK